MPTINGNGIELYYEVHGKGEPLLLIMGLGHNSLSWEKSLPALSNQFQVIIFDNRGTGRSSRPESDYSMEQMADDAISVLDAVNVESAHIYGVSMGGMIAQRLALNYPNRVKSLILGCTSPGGTHQVQPEASVMMNLLSRASIPTTPLEAARASLPIIFSQDFISTHQDSITEYINTLIQIPTPPHGFMHQLQAILQHNTYEELENLSIPTLIIHGDADRLVPLPNGKLLAESIKGAELFIVPGAGHLYMMEAEKMVDEKVIDFIKKQSIKTQIL